MFSSLCFFFCFFFSAIVIDISIIKFFIELSSHLLFYFVAFWVLFYIINLICMKKKRRRRKEKPLKQFEIFYWIIDDVNQWKLLAGKLSHQKVCLKKMKRTRIHPPTHPNHQLGFVIWYTKRIAIECKQSPDIGIFKNFELNMTLSSDFHKILCRIYCKNSLNTWALVLKVLENYLNWHSQFSQN